MILDGEDIGDFFLSACLGFSIFLQARSFDNDNYKGVDLLIGAGASATPSSSYGIL